MGTSQKTVPRKGSEDYFDRFGRISSTTPIIDDDWLYDWVERPPEPFLWRRTVFQECTPLKAAKNQWSIVKYAELQRIFKNFCEQNYVAEAMRMALTNLYNYRFEHDVKYNIVLQVHDELILCVPYNYVEEVVDKVLPLCMVSHS